MIIIQLILTVFMFAGLWSFAATRNWFQSLEPVNRRIVFGFLAIMLGCHFLGQCRQTFPFVRWAMYTRQFDSEEFNCIEIHAIDAKGNVDAFSPIKYYPSLTRNFYVFFVSFNKLANEEKLTASGEQVYEDLLQAILRRYNLDHPSCPAVRLQTVLVTANVKNGNPTGRNVVAQIDANGESESFRLTSPESRIQLAKSYR